MTTPVDPFSPGESLPDRIKHDAEAPGKRVWGTGATPPMVGKPLPADDIWVTNMVTMFKMPVPEAQLFAGRFRDNMFQCLNNQVKHDTQKQHETAQKVKQALEGND